MKVFHISLLREVVVAEEVEAAVEVKVLVPAAEIAVQSCLLESLSLEEASITYIFIAGPFMYGTHDRRRIICAPAHFWVFISLHFLFLQHVQKRSRDFLGLFGSVKQIHLVIFVSDLVRQTTSPCFDFVHLMLLLVIA